MLILWPTQPRQPDWTTWPKSTEDKYIQSARSPPKAFFFFFPTLSHCGFLTLKIRSTMQLSFQSYCKILGQKYEMQMACLPLLSVHHSCMSPALIVWTPFLYFLSAAAVFRAGWCQCFTVSVRLSRAGKQRGKIKLITMRKSSIIVENF